MNKASDSFHLFDLLEAGEGERKEGRRRQAEPCRASDKLATLCHHSQDTHISEHSTACGGVTAACTKTDGQPMKSEIFMEHSPLVLQSSKCCSINKGVDDRASV